VKLPRLFARDRLLATIVVLVAGAICVRLGIWQLDRLAQRRDFNHQVLAAQEMPPLELPSSEDLATQEYRAVRAQGTYDFGNQVVLRNEIYNGEYGFHLVTPLLLGAKGLVAGPGSQAVLVDRGWIPAAGNERASDWRKYDEPLNVAVAGLLRLAPAPPSFAGLAEPTPTPGNGKTDFWISLDIALIQKQAGYPLLPIYIQKIPGPNSSSPPIAVAPALDLSEGPHFGYAMQWFGFAALFVVGYPLYLRKQEGRRI
jgi:surfeit locus 1 family protein